MTETRTYGTWDSPLQAADLAGGTLSLKQPRLYGDSIYWLEGRASEGGRRVLVRRAPNGTTTDITPAPYSVSSRVHEYGGGAYIVINETVYFSNGADGRLYRQPLDGEPEPFTPDIVWRYADLQYDAQRERLLAVREDHTGDGEAVNTLVAIPLDAPESITVLAAGHDFFACPRLSPDGQQMAWLSWDHPNLPWNHTQLWLAALDADGTPESPVLVAGQEPESIFQPVWSPDNELYFVSDRNNWWNIYRHTGDDVACVLAMDAEFGLPYWIHGMSTYGFISQTEILCSVNQQTNWQVARLDVTGGTLHPIDSPLTNIDALLVHPGEAIILGGSPTLPRSVVYYDGEQFTICQQSAATIPPQHISTPQLIEFPTTGGLTAHALFYPPRNPDFSPPAGEKPPLLVQIHGGPTGSSVQAYDAEVQFWTTRGFALVDVNYGGSTGYGREYRERLWGQTGIVEVDDCVNAARYLANKGLVDASKLAIMGGSAGGYVALAALTFRDEFRAGASLYGISDIEILAKETHKFESRYTDWLVGPYPEQQALYHERSPLHSADQLNTPIIFLHGKDDPVVPPNQSEKLAAVLREKGIPVALILFDGESHGFKKAPTIQRSMEAVWYFFARIFDLSPLPPVDPVSIDNLD